jgi:hypothetical protein
MLTAVGVGGAAAQALEPDFIDIRQNSWKDNPNLVLEPELLARLVAQGGVDLAAASDEAAFSGLSGNRFRDLVWLEQHVPGAAELLFLWRYGKITEEEWREAMTKTGMRPDFIDAMAATFSLPLDAGAIATAVHRGIMAGAGLILQEPPTAPGVVPIVPPSTLDPVEQARALGISHEQLRVLVGNTGLPLSLFEMLQLLNRGLVTEDDVKRAIAESNLRNEYMDVAIPLKRRLLTPHEYAETELRGVKTHAEAQAGAKMHGLEAADYDALFEIIGRPLAVHQITTGLARGGTFGGTYADVPEPYRDAIRRSAIRPEYAQLAHANRYSYPSAFVMRSLAEAGDLGDTAAVALLLEEIGWPPALAAKVAAKWMPTGTSADTHVTKARAQLWTTTHSSYVKAEIGAADATTALTTAGVEPGSIAGVLAVWDAERSLIRKQLSVAQLQKALHAGITNPATGLPWTIAEGEAALVERGYSAADAHTIIAEG